MSNGNGENPYIINVVEPPLFKMHFQWKEKIKIIELKRGEDVLKLAEILKSLLDKHGIEYEERDK